MRKILVAVALVASIAGASLVDATPAAAYHGGFCYNNTWSLANRNTSSSCVSAIQVAINLRIGSNLLIDGYYGDWTAIGVLIDERDNPYFNNVFRPMDGVISAHSADWDAMCITLWTTAFPYGKMWAYFAGCP